MEFDLRKLGLLVAAIVVSMGGHIAAQVPGEPPPPDWNESGTIEGLAGDVLQIKNAAGVPWMVRVGPQAKVTVEGSAETSYLRPGINVQFSADLDAKFAVATPITELALYTPESKKDAGLYSGEDTKAVRKPAAGHYTVKGRVASLKGENLVVLAGGKKVAGKLSPQATIKVNVADIDLAQPGDTVKIIGWTSKTQRGQAESSTVSVTMAKPLAGVKKKIRQPRAARTKPAEKNEAKDFGFGAPAK